MPADKDRPRRFITQFYMLTHILPLLKTFDLVRLNLPKFTKINNITPQYGGKKYVNTVEPYRNLQTSQEPFTSRVNSC